MPVDEEFKALAKRYRRSPEFIGVELDDPNRTGMTGDTLLHAAVTRGSLNDVRILIKSGAQVSCIGDLGSTPLHYAASRGHRDIALELLHAGADPSIKNEFGQTPLDLALLRKQASVTELLKTRG